jgi:photoactive yellow protein
MADSEPDLYSFLRSKDIPSTDDEADPDAPSEPAAETNGTGAPSPDVQEVDSFADTGSSETVGDTDLAFEDDDLADKLGDLPEETLDEAPFGIVEVDDDGVVQFYNRYESQLAGVDPDDALGQNFFTRLAPCSGNRLFHGRFKKGIKKNALDERFTYTFTYKMSPTLVDVRMHRDDEGRNWVLIRKR